MGGRADQQAQGKSVRGRGRVGGQVHREMGRHRRARTQGGREPLWLVGVHHGDAQRVQGHKAQHDPVETLRLHHAADEEMKHLLFVPKVGRVLILPALEAGSGEGRTWERGQGRQSWVHTSHLPDKEANAHRSWGAPTLHHCPRLAALFS